MGEGKGFSDHIDRAKTILISRVFVLVREVRGDADAAAGDRITYKVIKYNYPETEDPMMRIYENRAAKVKWAVKVDGRREDLTVTGESVDIAMRAEWEGKEILVMAYLKEPLEKVSQKTKVHSCFVTRVEGPQMAAPKTKASYRVAEYNKDPASGAVRKEVKWAMRIGGEQENLPMKGELIEIEIKEAWLNQDILLMAYLLRPVAQAGRRTEIRIIIGEIFGYPESGANSWRQANDQIFINAVNAYNAKYELNSWDDAYVTPKMLKAQAMVETGGHKSDFLRDPLWVNYPKDWAAEKTSIAGITKNQVMTPAASAAAALEWWRYKGYLHDGKGGKVWEGNWKAYCDYNANYREKDRKPDGTYHAAWYANRITELYQGSS